MADVLRMAHSILIVGIVLAFLFQQGCSTVKPSTPVPSTHGSTVPKDLGNIAVTSAKYLPRAELQTPAKGALKGAGRGAVQMIDDLGTPPMLVVSIILAPIAAVVGGISGALSADSASSVNEKEALLKKALTEMKIQETMRDQFLKKTVEMPNYHFELLGEMGPRSIEDHPDYQVLKNKGIDTVYEIAVSELGLETESDMQIDPQLTFYMIVQTRLVSVADNKTIVIRPFACRSLNNHFAYWTAEQATHFRNEMDRCYSYLATEMINSLPTRIVERLRHSK